MLALLERLTFVRAIALPRHLGDNIHPARRAQFAREGAVAPNRAPQSAHTSAGASSIVVTASMVRGEPPTLHPLSAEEP